jgi:hypothetical protein
LYNLFHKAIDQKVESQIAMKTMSIFIILAYILLPAVCFAHPIELQVEAASGIYDIFASEYPDKQGMDQSESACCCEEHTLFVNRIINTFPAVRLSGSSPIFLNPQVFIPIFVPPQNIS